MYQACYRKKLEEEGYTKVIVKLDDSPEMINGLDGVICTGTFTKNGRSNRDMGMPGYIY